MNPYRMLIHLLFSHFGRLSSIRIASVVFLWMAALPINSYHNVGKAAVIYERYDNDEL